MSTLSSITKTSLNMGILTSLKSKSGLSSSPDDSHHEPPPPAYTEATSPAGPSSPLPPNGFIATSNLQVQSMGYDYNQALSGKYMENINVYRADTGDAEYISVRRKKSSNSCALVRTADPSQTPLISTIYRIGPGRSPRMRILHDNAGLTVDEAIANEDVRGELIEVKSRSMFSRTQIFDTSLGKFEWRYGDRHERDDADAATLLIMERVDRVTLPDGTRSESGAQVAQLIRSDEFRTPGSKKYSGGNGGRLMIDLRMWQDNKKTSVQDAEAFVVASCILMLKREADRYNDNQIATVV